MDDCPRHAFKTMETQTAFDLNLAIRRWREDLARSSAFRSENLNELESHLRDSIAAWQTKELSEREAFMIATQRVGVGRQLENEFAKLNRNTIWLERLLWMLIGVQVWMLVNGVAGLMTENVLLSLGTVLRADVSSTLLIALSITVRSLVVVGAAWLCWWFMTRNSETRARWIETKLQPRSVFWIYCIASSLMLIAAQSLFFVFQYFWLAHVGAQQFGRSSVYLNYSQIITHLMQFIVMIVLILTLARKRLQEKRA
jgi:hypothetical protein